MENFFQLAAQHITLQRKHLMIFLNPAVAVLCSALRIWYTYIRYQYIKLGIYINHPSICFVCKRLLACVRVKRGCFVVCYVHPLNISRCRNKFYLPPPPHTTQPTKNFIQALPAYNQIMLSRQQTIYSKLFIVSDRKVSWCGHGGIANKQRDFYSCFHLLTNFDKFIWLYSTQLNLNHHRLRL